MLDDQWRGYLENIYNWFAKKGAKCFGSIVQQCIAYTVPCLTKRPIMKLRSYLQNLSFLLLACSTSPTGTPPCSPWPVQTRPSWRPSGSTGWTRWRQSPAREPTAPVRKREKLTKNTYSCFEPEKTFMQLIFSDEMKQNYVLSVCLIGLLQRIYFLYLPNKPTCKKFKSSFPIFFQGPPSSTMLWWSPTPPPTRSTPPPSSTGNTSCCGGGRGGRSWTAGEEGGYLKNKTDSPTPAFQGSDTLAPIDSLFCFIS